MLEHVPFGPDADPRKAPFLIVVNDDVLKTLRAKEPLMQVYEVGIALPDDSRVPSVPRITGFNVATFKPVGVARLSRTSRLPLLGRLSLMQPPSTDEPRVMGDLRALSHQHSHIFFVRAPCYAASYSAVWSLSRNGVKASGFLD